MAEDIVLDVRDLRMRYGRHDVLNGLPKELTVVE